MNNTPFLSRAIVGTVLLAVSGMLGSCTAPAEPINATADDGPLSGELRATTFTVEEHERIIVEGDLHIIADEQVAILGEMIGRHGATIEITAPSITVYGTIQAGDGDDRHGVLEHGQHGGDIIFNSPQIDLSGGTLIGGRGGNAGPAGNGGNGGYIFFNDAVNVLGPGGRLVGGDGGKPGHGISGHGDAARHGGRGGDGGGVRNRPAPRVAR